MHDRPIAQRMRRLSWQSLIVGLLGLLVCAGAAALDLRQFFWSWLTGWSYWWSLSVGCLVLTMLTHVAGGGWGVAARPFFDSGLRTMPLVALAGVPLAFGLEAIYPWARAEWLAEHHLSPSKEFYFDPAFFLGRAAGYFAVWLVPTFFLIRWIPMESRTAGGRPARKVRLLSAGGILLSGLAITFAAMDWMMSLDPEWYSSIFGALIAVGSVLAAMALAVCVSCGMAVVPPVHRAAAPQIRNDFGNLLLAFVMIWTYFAFSQYLIIWSGNLPHEVVWHLHRQAGGWEWIGLPLLLFHFGVPFLLLLSREIKQHAAALAGIAFLLLVMRWLDLFWTIAPSLYGRRFALHWADAASMAGIGGVWLAIFFGALARRLPPRIEPEGRREAAAEH